MRLRTIKFRGKSIYDEEWLYGSLVRIEKDRYAIIPPLNDIEIGKSIGMYEVCLETIGQFTGVKYNDREIYEHDLIECAGVLCEIVYNDKIGAFVLLEVLTQNLGSKPIGQMIDLFCIKYVGNIYDHPQLIKKE